VNYVPNVVKEKRNTVEHNRKDTVDTLVSNVLSNVNYVPIVVKKRNTLGHNRKSTIGTVGKTQ
jgi:hypothetical protein